MTQVRQSRLSKRQQSARQRRKKRQRAASGKCRECGHLAVPGRRLCERHLEAARSWARLHYEPKADSRRCRLCRKLGHNAATCRWRASQPSTSPDPLARATCRCSSCGKLGHNRRTCPCLVPRSDYLPAAPAKRRRCSHCGNEGHYHKACPLFLSRRRGRARQRCRLCLGRGHHWRLCPKRPCGFCQELGHDWRACPKAPPPQSSVPR